MQQESLLREIFGLVAPGKPLRVALERIQEASLGALIVLSSLENMEKYIDGGFILNTPFNPQKVYELAKMDGAVLISEDLGVIHGANIQLQPDKYVETDESGTRHRTAQRIAKLTGSIVITVSERRKRITIYKGEVKRTLELVGDLLIKSSQAIMSLEKYASSVNNYMEILTIAEFEDEVVLEDVLNGLRHFYLMFNMDKEVREYVMELGIEGRLVELQHHEIMLNQKANLLNFMKDYTLKYAKHPDKIFDELMKLNDDEIKENENIAYILGYDLDDTMLDEKLEPKGYRLLGNVNRLTKKDTETIIENCKNLKNLVNTTYDEIYEMKGITKFKAEKIMKIIEKYKNKAY